MGFVEGAGILISGTGATGNTIESNDIGTDPTGTQALPNAFGVQIIGGASGNLVGGATAGAGNLIAFNAGPGTQVEGYGSVGNQITANQIFSNDSGTTLQFDGSTYVSLPNDLVDGSAPEQTIEARFETTSGGVILGYQSSTPGGSPYYGWIPSIYVGIDGRLYGGSYDPNNYSLVQVTSSSAVNDGRWHDLALVFDGESQTFSLYLDGQLVGSVAGVGQDIPGSSDQIGMGFAGFSGEGYWPDTPGGWYGFVGQISDVRIWSEARTAGEIGGDMSSGLSGALPGSRPIILSMRARA